jgi:16S rRNA processing protein RimM
MTKKIIIAIIAAPQGLDGSVRLKSFADTPENLKKYKSFETTRGTLTLKSLRVQPNAIVAKFAEITDRTAAEKWRGVELSVERLQLPDLENGEYYQADIIGMTVFSNTGGEIGIVKSIENYGAADLIDITLALGGSLLVPFIDDAVLEIDDMSQRIIISENFLDDTQNSA